jgi:rhodanese-related sulfurtransferase
MANRSVLGLQLQTAIFQMLFILMVSGAVGFFVNMIRSNGIPVIGDWSTEGRMTDVDGSSLVIKISEAKENFNLKQAVFLDARDKEFFDQGHIKGAKNLPWYSVDDHFIDIVDGMSNDTLIITYCDGENCDLSHELALFLKEMGFFNVKVLVNGWTVWQEMNLPVEGDSFANELKNILIISIDALHPKALIKTSSNLQQLMEQGVYTLDGFSTKPPLTLVSHAAMFSGIGPEKGGRQDNEWHPGQPGIKGETIFNIAKSQGYSTGFFYSKEKLGFLANQAVDQQKLDKDFSVENAIAFFKTADKKCFSFLHISGLDRTGSIEGWLSPGYMEELFFIDESIAPLIEMVKSKGSYLIIVTSDHAGHGTIHGSNHPDDTKLPLIMVSDVINLTKYQGIKYQVTQLKPTIESVFPFQKKSNQTEGIPENDSP